MFGRIFRVHTTPSVEVIDAAVWGTMFESRSSYISVSNTANVGAPSSVDAVVYAGSRLLKSVVASLTMVPPGWMSFLGAVDDVVVTLMMLAAMGAALVVVLLVRPRLTVVAVLPAVVAVGAATVVLEPATVDAVGAAVDVVDSATVVLVVCWATGFLLTPPHEAATRAQMTVIAAT